MYLHAPTHTHKCNTAGDTYLDGHTQLAGPLRGDQIGLWVVCCVHHSHRSLPPLLIEYILHNQCRSVGSYLSLYFVSSLHHSSSPLSPSYLSTCFHAACSQRILSHLSFIKHLILSPFLLTPPLYVSSVSSYGSFALLVWMINAVGDSFRLEVFKEGMSQEGKGLPGCIFKPAELYSLTCSLMEPISVRMKDTLHLTD